MVPTLGDEPRQEPNLAPGVYLPAARAWRPERPGDEVADGQPRGQLLGTPGPNTGYAFTLAQRLADRLSLVAHEHLGDAISVVAAVAAKRAASYRRAPVRDDVECAALVLGYLGEAPEIEFAHWRGGVVRGADHDYVARQAVCDAIEVSDLCPAPHDLAPRVRELRVVWRERFRPGA